MTSALQRQCARPLFIVVAALLLCCCRSAEDDWDSRNFTCTKTGDKLRGGLTIPRDNQIHIDPSELGYYQQIRVLVVNAKDENLTMTVVGAEPSCRRSFSNRTKCRLSEEKNASLEHQSKECTAHAGCKEFSFSCKNKFSKWSNSHGRIFIVDMNLLFRQFAGELCNKSQVYIDDARLLNNRRDPPGERCPESTDTTTTQSTTTMLPTTGAIGLFLLAGLIYLILRKMFRPEHEFGGMRRRQGNNLHPLENNSPEDWTYLIIVLAVIGAGVLIAVLFEMSSSLYSKASPDDDDEGASVV
uniref:Autophagy-related protein 27 n=1 Tax=Globodera rostochiensis TaxID=31243 RepID=A0A914H781_GLORO